jgi:SAM-dependent MidA family methyltransferase
MQGAIPFVRFMEQALGCPVYGYYEKEGDTVGRRGDFFTSVSVGSLYGELLAARFAAWLETLISNSKVQSPKSSIPRPRDKRMQIVEAGAHDGMLALDILTWMGRRRPGLLEGLEYWIVEPSIRRQASQRRTLAGFSSQVRWVEDLQALARSHTSAGGVHGIIFCNELLDALPVRRLGWDVFRRCWFEWGVALDADRFVWTRMPVTEPAPDLSWLYEQAAGLVEVLPDGFSVEVSPAAVKWWAQAAACLSEGNLLTVDYGLTDEELFMPERKEGTLRGYRRHRLSSDILADPGEQDITAHVNFGMILRAGESAGLKTDGLLHQSRFLTPLAELVAAEWTLERRRQFQTLTHPEHLGRAFRVLIQSRPVKVNS